MRRTRAGSSFRHGEKPWARAGEPGDPVAVCVLACVTNLDCLEETPLPTHDADNYACEDGGCHYLGCNSDQECEGATPGTICRDGGCEQACAVPADCSQGIPAKDTDNYACEMGMCVYLGCHPGECGIDSTCIDNQSETPFCGQHSTLSCFGELTCGFIQPQWDEDNFVCIDDVCVYAGCNTDAECIADHLSPATLCRVY